MGTIAHHPTIIYWTSHQHKATPILGLQVFLECPQLPRPLAPFSMVTASYLQLVDLTSQAFVDHVIKIISLCAAVRAALLASLSIKPLVETRLTKVLTTAHSEVRVTENLGANLTVVSIGHFVDKV